MTTLADKQSELKLIEDQIELKSLINFALASFPKSFINEDNEIILIPKYNEYFLLGNVDSALIFKCKMLEWLSRPIAKGLPKKQKMEYLLIFNRFMQSDFTLEDMQQIYTVIGNCTNRELTIQFIESGYDMELLIIEKPQF